MTKRIPLEDVFDGYCEYAGCRYNNDECCHHEEHISNYMSYIKGSDKVSCYGFSVKDGCCEECGTELEKCVDKVEFWGAMVDMESSYCPNCG